MEIRRFGPGHRRPDGPPGTKGVTGQVIHNDPRGVIAELAFQRYAMITPHSNPNLTLFVVISGGGFVQVGDERARVNHGEAVVWPAGVVHGAYTDGSEMRAVVIELPDETASPAILEGVVRQVTADADGGRVPDGGGGTRDGVEGDWPPAATSGQESGEVGRDPAGQGSRPVERARGRLAERPVGRDDYDQSSGEPW